MTSSRSFLPKVNSVTQLQLWFFAHLSFVAAFKLLTSSHSPMFADWQGKAEDEDLTIWEDNWDDDNIEDDFSKQLK